MLEVDPKERVSLHLGGAMSARSAIQKVMLEWPATMRRNLRITQDAVILRKNTSSILKLSDVEELWSRPEFQITTKRYLEFFYHAVGLVLLFLAQLKHTIEGYKTPKPIRMNDEQCIKYDIDIADGWLSALEKYAGAGCLTAADLLELGPGSDLGTGLYLISKGAQTYCAIDAFGLATSAPRKLYEKLISQISKSKEGSEGVGLRETLAGAIWGPTKRIDYIVSPRFDICTSLRGRCFDIIFSNAAFEHFESVEQTIVDISSIARKGATLVCGVDLMTHSRWIRQRDPNNIYRYPDWVYRMFRFKGVPNRVRPHQYKVLLEKNGWTNVTITPDLRLYNFNTRYLARRFRDPINQMDFLTITICATKAA
jgi:hypothetical protein